jgi:hypothetical protein
MQTRSFTDNSGRTWELMIDVPTLRRVKQITGVNLSSILKPGGSDALTDPVTLADVLYVVCQPAADAANVSDEDFGRSLRGDAIDAAGTALLEAVADFMPPDRGALIHKSIARACLASKVALAQAVQILDSAPDSEIFRVPPTPSMQAIRTAEELGRNVRTAIDSVRKGADAPVSQNESAS